MRTIEITLKVLFLAGAVALMYTSSLMETPMAGAFAAIALLLGVILIFNAKHPSYKYPANYKYNGRVLAMRRVEGVLLVMFSMFLMFYGH